MDRLRDGEGAISVAVRLASSWKLGDVEMKFSFKNIGPVREATLTLGDLTVIAGANNTGKTYLTYAIYGFLSTMSNPEEREMLMMEHNMEGVSKRAPLKMNIDDYRSETGKNMSRCIIKREDAIAYAQEILNSFGHYSASQISGIFSSHRENFQKSEMTVSKSVVIAVQEIIASRSVPPYVGQIKSVGKNGDFEMIFAKKMTAREKWYVRHTMDVFLMGTQFPVPPFLLSSERFGISLFYKELDFAKSRLVEMLQSLSNEKTKKESSRRHGWLTRLRKYDVVISEGARYAQPIRDNIDFIRNLENIQEETCDFLEDKFFDDIKGMMGGYYRYENNEIQFISSARKKNGFVIPLHLASSSARGLAGFYFYLKHAAKKGQLLIMDEPESHLNPANQILLARLLARCVNAGLKVLINTHSDYLIKELNNLIMLSQLEGKSAFLKKRKEYSENDFLDRKSVKGYVCENGGVTECEITSRGINMPVFDGTIDSINEVSEMLHMSLPDELG